MLSIYNRQTLNNLVTGLGIMLSVAAAAWAESGVDDPANNSHATATYVVSCSGADDFTTIQAAIDAAADGDVIVVRPNDCTPEKRYFETIDFHGKSILLRSVHPTNPQVVKSTVIDGSVTGGSVVSFVNGEGRRAMLDGLTITGGTGTDMFHPAYGSPWDSYVGGGILCIGSSPTIRHCQVIENTATTGGGIGAFASAPLVTDSRIALNLTEERESMLGAVLPEGGGIALFNSPAHILRCIIERNVADPTDNFLELSTGGGVIIATSPLLPEFKGRPVIENCRLIANVARGSLESFQPTTGGAALYAFELNGEPLRPLDFVVLNSLIVGNTSFDAGGAIAVFGQTPHSKAEIRGCTIVGNSDVKACVLSASTVTTVRNTIFHDNDTLFDFRESATSLATVNYCKLDTTVFGVGNISVNPKFVDAANGDYHLSPDSPCRNAGDPRLRPLRTERDIDGGRRIEEHRVDIGVDEFEPE